MITGANRPSRRFRRVETLVRAGSAVARLVPTDIRLFRDFLILGSDAFRDYKFDFVFRTLRLNIRWSAAGFPDLLTKHMLFDGSYQPDVILWIDRHCRKGDVVFDAGAFHGVMTVVASKAVGQRGKVVAFEPNPGACEHLQRHVELNRCRNVTIEPVGLLDSEGSREFYAQTGSITWNSSFVKDFADPMQVTPIQVQSTTIDRYVETTALIPDFIKVDTEGTELRVLKGAVETIRTHMPILVVEFNPESANQAGTSTDELAEWLRTAGYTLSVIPMTRWGRYKLKDERPYQQAMVESGEKLNVLCMPRRARRQWAK